MTHPTTAVSSSKNFAAQNHWEQIAAAGGILFVILQLLSQMLIQIGGSEPPFDASAALIVDYFMQRNLTLALTGGFLSTLSTMAFLGFLGALYAALKREEGEPGWLSLVAFGSGITAVATLLGSGGGWELALLRIGDGQQAAIAQLLFDQGNHTFASFWVSLAGMLLAAGILTLRNGPLPRWLGWFGLLVAVALLAVRPIWFTAPGVKFLPYVFFWIWLIATSIILIRQVRRNQD